MKNERNEIIENMKYYQNNCSNKINIISENVHSNKKAKEMCDGLRIYYYNSAQNYIYRNKRYLSTKDINNLRTQINKSFKPVFHKHHIAKNLWNRYKHDIINLTGGANTRKVRIDPSVAVYKAQSQSRNKSIHNTRLDALLAAKLTKEEDYEKAQQYLKEVLVNG